MKQWSMRDGLTGAAWQWPASGQMALILDGIAIDELPRRIYEWGEDQPDAQWLYLGTPWESVKQASPWLVFPRSSQDPIVRHFLNEGAGKEWGYLLFSTAGREALTAHCRWLLQMVGSGEQFQMMRMSHPVVIQALLPADTSPDATPWGPIEQLIVPDALAGKWQSGAPAAIDGAPPTADYSDWFRPDEATWQRLDHSNRRLDARRLSRFVDANLPQWLPSELGDGREQWFLQVMEEAISHGLEGFRSWCLYCQLLAQLQIGPNNPGSIPDAIEQALKSGGPGNKPIERALEMTQAGDYGEGALHGTV